ncbi:MAG: transposase [Deltaproteobacteria bacterium]|nr:transposase [Deltaproteobacteria bacterium]
MARKPRIQYPGAFYHVIARGNGEQKIFRDSQDYERYLNFLMEYKVRFGFLLYAYALMPTHIHLLLEMNKTPLSKLMQVLQFRYTRNFNIKYKKWGHLFQGRYKAILCDKDSYFLELSAYIHLNPVRGGLVKKPHQYPWSSYRFYVRIDSVSDALNISKDLFYSSTRNRPGALGRAVGIFGKGISRYSIQSDCRALQP